jgi:hypothetical protein
MKTIILDAIVSVAFGALALITNDPTTAALFGYSSGVWFTLTLDAYHDYREGY